MTQRMHLRPAFARRCLSRASGCRQDCSVARPHARRPLRSQRGPQQRAARRRRLRRTAGRPGPERAPDGAACARAACAAAGDADAAFRLYAEMRAGGVPTEAKVYAALISACNQEALATGGGHGRRQVGPRPGPPPTTP